MNFTKEQLFDAIIKHLIREGNPNRTHKIEHYRLLQQIAFITGGGRGIIRFAQELALRARFSRSQAP